MDAPQTIKKINALINESNNILLVCHRYPDGDTLGSNLAFAYYFDRLNKNYSIYCQDPPASFFSFLPNFKKIQTGLAPRLSAFDLIIASDCGDLNQTGLDLAAWSENKTPLINIDHHLTNTHFGAYNLILPDVASTTAVLYHFFSQNFVNLDRALATCLLTGLITDTNNFSNLSTNQDALEVASRLVAKGAQIRYINHYIIKNKSVPVLKLWSRIFLRLQKNPELDFAWTIITKKDKEDCAVDDSATEGLSNIFNELADSAFSLVLEEIAGGYVKGSLRTTRDYVDVSEFAKIMGGGGHRRAAGFRLRGQLQEMDNGWEII